MSVNGEPPLVLLIDDVFGRTVRGTSNKDRAFLCQHLGLRDISAGGEAVDAASAPSPEGPIDAVFCRGQKPIAASVGDVVANDLDGTMRVIREGWTGEGWHGRRWALVLLDLCFLTGRVENSEQLGMPVGKAEDDAPGSYFGLKVLEAIHNELPELPVVILSSQPREEVSRRFSALGAFGFLPRTDANASELLRQYIWRHGLIEDESGMIEGQSLPLLMALRAARRAGTGKDAHILVRGERGSGKELFARYLHQQRADPDREPFEVVNSAVLSNELYASELFGVVSGVATDVTGREGLIPRADGGDLFFDEIKDMVAQAQAGLLRVLEDGCVTAVGARESQSVAVRFLSATNGDIEAYAATGRFRADLLDRLRSGGTIVVPPLRDRVEDIRILAERFVREAEQTIPNALRREIDSEVIEMLIGHDWPGNVRELRGCLTLAVRNHPDVEHLVPLHIQFQDRGRKKRHDAEQRESSKENLPEDSLSELVRMMRHFGFNGMKPHELPARLDEIEEASACLIGHYLEAALVATRKVSPIHPEGKVQIHPAAKLITGDSSLTGSKAADLVKRLLRRSPAALDELLETPIIKSAYDTARRLRPSASRSKSAEE